MNADKTKANRKGREERKLISKSHTRGPPSTSLRAGCVAQVDDQKSEMANYKLQIANCK
jgi:hypothetical protein